MFLIRTLLSQGTILCIVLLLVTLDVGFSTAKATTKPGKLLLVLAGCLVLFGGMELLSRGGDPADGRKVKGATMHWVDANNCAEAEVRLYSSLFSDPEPDAAGKDFIDCLNPESLEVLTGCKVERMLESAKPSDHFQFLRMGYFCADSKDSAPGHLVFNRSVELKGSYKP